MTAGAGRDRRDRRRWEQRLLALLAYPANLAFAGVAAFLLAVPVVTWVASWVAAGRALHAWQVHHDDRVFTGTFRQFAAVWRRCLPAGVVATLVVAVLVTNLLFLGAQDSPASFLFGMATVPVAAGLGLIMLLLPAAAAYEPDATMRRWLRVAAALAAARPLNSLVLVAIAAAVGLTCVLLPTIAPFFGISLPVWLGLLTAQRAAGPPGTAGEPPTGRRTEPQ